MFQLRRIIALLKVPGDDPELTLSQYYAVTGQLPLLYLILLLNTLALAATHLSSASPVLTILFPALFTVAVVVRICSLRRSVNRRVTPEAALRALRLTNRLSPLVSIILLGWALSLSRTGDEFAKAHVAFYISITVIGCIFSLMHLRSAALMVTVIVATPATALFMCSGQPVLVAIGLNFLLVAIFMIMILGRHYRDFVLLSKSSQELIARQIETQRLSDENFRLANIDAVTGLANRRGFFRDLDQAIDKSTEAHEMLAIGLIDLDGFKSINDIFGHATGDMVLHEVGRRLAALAGASISFARLGGDEFGMLFFCDANRSTSELASQISTSLRECYVMPATTMEISASIGIAELPQAGCTAAQLFERADYALYHAKQTLRGLPVLFSAAHQDALRDAACLDRVLQHADLQTEMFMLFQPIVDVERGRTVAFECLARWNSPELGPIAPTVFIKAAERCNLINRLTEVLLYKSLAAARSWPDGMHISFNLSVRDIGSEEAVHRIADIVLASGIAPDRIEFEITETAVMRDFEQARQSLLFLRALGSRIALDDFGTGYSSLSYVHRLPLDKIKVDRSFTLDIENEAAGLNIVTTVLDLCRNLKLRCVVEGLETAPQVAIIGALGCSLMQGYFFGRPMRQEDLNGFLARELNATPSALLYPVCPVELPIAV